MSFFLRISWLCLLACGAIFPATLATQSTQSSSSDPVPYALEPKEIDNRMAYLKTL